MKKLVLAGIMALSLLLITGVVYAEEKSAYVDLGKIFDQYNKTKEYDKILNKEQKDYEDTREDKLEEVRKLQEKISLLSDEEKEVKKGDLEAKITQLQEFDRDKTQDLRKKRDEKVQEIFKDINEAIEAYAKKQGIGFVFDSRALIYIDKSLEISDKILKEINK